MVVLAYNCIYSGSGGRKNMSLRTKRQKLTKLLLKNKIQNKRTQVGHVDSGCGSSGRALA
jgi:hypothetical protein